MNITPELLPLVEWWEKDGKKTVALLAVVALGVAAFYGVKHYRAAQRVAAAEAVLEAYTVEDLESAVTSYGKLAVGPVLKLRLAHRYYDGARYDDALAIYRELENAAPLGFEDVPALGIANTLEAQGKYDEALAAFDGFAAERAGSVFALSAKLGACRALTGAGKREEALKRLATLEQEYAADEAAKTLVINAKDLVTRWEKRAERSVFDAADAAAKALEEKAAETK